MSLFYKFLQLTVPVSCNTFFGEIRRVNTKNVPKGEPIIFVANHPSAILDPLVCGISSDVPLHFLGRADLFKSKFSSWFLRGAHMWPIYRDVDGKDSLEKNEQVFAECYASLIDGNPILLYGEGFTDERFIRRVKQIKKGAARIAFGAESSYDFKMGLKIVPMGINYTNSEEFGSDLMVRFGEPIIISEYKAQFEENQIKPMLEVTRIISKRILENTIHIDKASESRDLENVLMLFEESMHYNYLDGAPDFEKRWDNSKKVADKLNEADETKKESFYTRVKSFWNTLKADGSELFVINELNGKKVNFVKEVIELVLGFPLALAGFLLNMPAFILLKVLPPTFTKRVCFYSGLRVALGIFMVPLLLTFEYLLSLPFIYVPYLYPMMLVAGFVGGIYALRYRQVFRRLKRKSKAKKILSMHNMDSLKQEYQSLITSFELL